MDQIITINEAARRLHVSLWTLRQWDKAGILRAIQTRPRAKRKYRVQDIEAFIKQSMERKPAAPKEKSFIEKIFSND